MVLDYQNLFLESAFDFQVVRAELSIPRLTTQQSNVVFLISSMTIFTDMFARTLTKVLYCKA